VSRLPEVSDASRLFCIGRNYAAHAREMGAERPEEPVIFIKPGSVRRGPGPVILPTAFGRVDFEGELLLLLSGEPETPVAGVSLGVDLTLRERQAALKRKGLPWETAKAFEGSALMGDFSPLPAPEQLDELAFETRINGEVRQRGRASDMLFTPLELIRALSVFWQPRAGDVLFTGTPEGVGPIQPGDVIELQTGPLETGIAMPLGPFQWQMEKT